MHVQVCFPFFDTRFLREMAGGEADASPAPRWLYGDPPPPFEWVGRFGRVDKRLPPLPYARCLSTNLVSLQPPEDVDATDVEPSLDWIETVADQHGHARLTIGLDLAISEETGLAGVAERLMRSEVAVRHPERHDMYEMLAEAGEVLADLYARESARTAVPPQGPYLADWVVAARPFLIMVNTRRDPVRVDESAIRVPGGAFEGSLSFLPWRAPEGDLALPVWYIDAPRGGEAWRQTAEAVEEVNARYEELFTCLLLREEAAGAGAAAHNFSVYLEKHCKRLAASLRRTQRHGVDLQAILRLVSDYDRSQLKPRESEKYTSALLERISAELVDKSRTRSGEQNFIIGNVNVTINSSGTGNIINFGTMVADTIQTTNSMLAESQSAPDLKQKLEELRAPLIEASKQLPPPEAANLLEDYKMFTQLALREDPPKEVVKAQGNQIVNALKKVAEYTEPVTKIIGAVFKIIAIF
jgi:hypothetical protein